MRSIKHHIIASTLLTASIMATPVLAQTRLNLVHLAPFNVNLPDTAVSVNINGSELIPSIVYGNNSGYLTLATSGTTDIDVFAPPGGSAPAISTSTGLMDNTDYSVAVIGDVNNQILSLLLLEDDADTSDTDNAQVRVVHAAPFANNPTATAVSIRLDDGTVINGLDNVSYPSSSGFFSLAPGTYDLQVATPDGSSALIDLAPLTLLAGDTVTLYAIGDDTSQPLGMYAVFGNGNGTTLALEGDTINAGLSGAWFNPETNGQGFFIDVMPTNGTVFLSWFTYDSQASSGTATVGAPEQRWLTAQGSINGNTSSMVVSNSSGGVFDDSAAVSTSAYGTIELSFQNCSMGTVTYNLTDIGLSGTIPIQRISNDNVALCQALQGN